MSLFKVFFLFIALSNAYETLNYRTLKIAMVTDVHIGEGCNGNLTLEACKPMRALSDAFNKMNTLGLDGVFISGDLTCSALREEFQTFRSLLDILQVPWWPLLGNHDVWPYNRHSDGSFNQTETPVGDQYLGEIFADILSGKYNNEKQTTMYANTSIYDWPDSSCLNGYYKTYNSWFHNFEVKFPLFSNDLSFIALDWNARGAALPEPGVGPEAELHDFECGTLDWLNNKLKSIKQENEKSKIFIVQHHPFHNREILDPLGKNIFFNFTFDKQQDQVVQKVLSEYFRPSSYIGVQAGHMHRWFNGSAFTPKTSIDDIWTQIPEWETPASKGWWVNEAYVSSMSVFTFEADSTGGKPFLKTVEGLWKTPNSNDWEIKPAVENQF